MSRMGNKPIIIDANVKVTVSNQEVVCAGKNGSTTIKIHPKIEINHHDGQIILERLNNDKLSKSLHGVTRKLIINAIAGVINPYEKKLQVNGIGYRVSILGKNLELSLGYSHPIKYSAPDGINLKVNKNIISISGIDKQLVGQVAAKIRSFRTPEPYKGKGIKYLDEIIKRKAGKSAKTAGAVTK